MRPKKGQVNLLDPTICTKEFEKRRRVLMLISTMLTLERTADLSAPQEASGDPDWLNRLLARNLGAILQEDIDSWSRLKLTLRRQALKGGEL